MSERLETRPLLTKNLAGGSSLNGLLPGTVSCSPPGAVGIVARPRAGDKEEVGRAGGGQTSRAKSSLETSRPDRVSRMRSPGAGSTSPWVEAHSSAGRTAGWRASPRSIPSRRRRPRTARSAVTVRSSSRSPPPPPTPGGAGPPRPGGAGRPPPPVGQVVAALPAPPRPVRELVPGEAGRGQPLVEQGVRVRRAIAILR